LLDFFRALQLLAGACELLGSTFSLTMNFTAAPAGTSWCEEAYIITVADAQPQQKAPVRNWNTTLNNNIGARAAAAAAVGATTGSSNSSSSRRQLGQLLLLFDSRYDGLPYTTTVRWEGAS
jgi:hypothetical protein